MAIESTYFLVSKRSVDSFYYQQHLSSLPLQALLAAYALGLSSNVCAQFNFAEDVASFHTIYENVDQNLAVARKAQIDLAKNARRYQKGNFIANIKAELASRVDFTIGLPRSPVL